MSLLTDDEIDAAWARSPQNNLRDYAKEIEAAVIRKLAAVSVEPCAWEVQRAMAGPHLSYSKTKGALSNEPLYRAKALAAARVQENERIAKHFETAHPAYWDTVPATIRALVGGQK
jgi:hypothetical protein